MTPAPRLHEAAERLALVLSGQGLQRMTARVLTALLFSEKSSVTMSELADELQASAGAISGALKNLTSVGLVERVPAPASRRDHFRLRPDAWATLYTGQNQTIAAFLQAAEGGMLTLVSHAALVGAITFDVGRSVAIACAEHQQEQPSCSTRHEDACSRLEAKSASAPFANDLQH